MNWLELSMYFLAAINPASKIFLLASMDPPCSFRQLLHISCKASFTALIILLLFAAAGQFILIKIFSINIYSLKIAGGIVLFTVGLTAVSKGRFYEQSPAANPGDLSIVPLAAPLIAGPATIAAGVAMVPIAGMGATMAALSVAVFLNMLLMTCALKIGRFLDLVHAIGPIIRITGLIVMAMAVQMILNGTGEWAGRCRLTHPDPAADTVAVVTMDRDGGRGATGIQETKTMARRNREKNEKLFCR